MATVTLDGQARTLRYGFLAFRRLAEVGVNFVPDMPSADMLWAPATQVKILWAGCLAESPELTVEAVERWLDPLDFTTAYDALAEALRGLLEAWEGEQRRPPPTPINPPSSVMPNAPPSDSAIAPGSSIG